MSKFKWFLGMILPLFVLGCMSTSATPTSEPTPLSVEDGWTIKMTQSGGIMGLMRSIEVNSGGSYTVNDERASQHVSGTLTKSQLDGLNKVLTVMQFTPSRPTGVCADCFIYEIDIQANGNQTLIQVDDLSLPDSGMVSLITELRGLMESALK
ncbi:MAG: hypothetical protein KJZ72_13385 [Anaerolineales bacterium]|nr:hypothetical protein [Anaerolineales bacterium]